MLFDTHCHIFDDAFNEDREEVIERIKDMKVMIVGFNIETNTKAILLGKRLNMPFSCGIHPTDVSNEMIPYLEELKTIVIENKAYAIGECGLDYYWHKDNKEMQKDFFIKQIELSIELGLPLIIHIRDAVNDAYEILKNYKGKIKGVMHSYSGSYEMALKFIDIGLYIGLGGPVTFKNAVTPKEVATKVDLDKIVIETDCPYLTPHPFRGKRNEPIYVSYVCEEIARLKGLDYETVENITFRNGINLFKMEE